MTRSGSVPLALPRDSGYFSEMHPRRESPMDAVKNFTGLVVSRPLQPNHRRLAIEVLSFALHICIGLQRER